MTDPNDAHRDATWALREPSIWESPDGRSIPTLLAAIGQVLATIAHPPTPADTRESDHWLTELREAHRDSYPMGNIHHGTDANPDWGTFCVACKQSWPCDVSRLLNLLLANATPTEPEEGNDD